jgi:hypothetical protein
VTFAWECVWLGDDAIIEDSFTPGNRGNQANHNNQGKCNLQSYLDKLKEVGFEVLTAVSMKMGVVWVVAPCSLVHIALMMEAARTSETLVNFYQTTRRYNPEES